MSQLGALSPVYISLNGYAPEQEAITPVQDTAPTAGESVIYKIPPAFWILLFLLVGYLGIRFVMED